MADLRPQLAERIASIASDRTHGGGWLAREAVETLMEAIELGEPPLEVARALVSARPSMEAIAGALGRVLVAASSPEQMLEEARAVLAARDRAPKVIAVLLHDELKGTVVTHSASATVREALVHSQPDRVLCTVSDPGGEGRTFATELRESGLTVELIDDGEAARAASSGDLVLLGADTVFRDGVLLNKIGTRTVATAAEKAGVPVIVACEVIKLAAVASPQEVPPAETAERDLTPPEQIRTFVTEEGDFPPGDVAALIDRTPFLRDASALFGEESEAERA